MRFIYFSVAPRIEGNAESIIENVTSVHGLPFNVHCPAVGEPTPKISWMKDGALLRLDTELVVDGGHGETLHFRHTYEHHSGNYTCVAANNAGVVSKTFILDVFGKEHLNFYFCD